MDAGKFNPLIAIGCNDPSDALLCLPKTYIDKTQAFRCLEDAPLNRAALFEGFLESFRGLDADGKTTSSPYPRSIEISLRFQEEVIPTRLFGMRKEDLALLVGEWVIIEGVLRRFPSGFYLSGVSFSALTGEIEPQYVGAQGVVSGEKILDAVRAALESQEIFEAAAASIEAVEPIRALLSANGLDAMRLLHGIHRPRSLAQGDRALQIARACTVREIQSLAASTAGDPKPAAYNIDEHLIRLVGEQKETLSPDQRRALNAIRQEINTRRGARILLNGDVGTGKTLVFLLAIASIAMTSGRAVAVVVPSDLVARQIHAQALSRFPQLQPALVLAGSEPPPASSLLLVGTQALFSRTEHLDFEALVVDEQHKFSVEQRAILAREETHVIEASATPIPRSLALALFDGWKQVRITKSPVEKSIASRMVMNEDRRKVSGLVRSHLMNGRKVIFLYPKVRGEGASVKGAGERLAEHFPNQVGVLHGQMKSDAKNAALQCFSSGEKPIIAASTAVEVGVDVPNIGLMVVSGADRFGVAQLHQLRGRLARNGGAADFVMVLSKRPSRSTEQRLQALCEHPDGFSLAERDMEIRGFGDVLGDFQIGRAMTTFKLTRLEVEDFTRVAQHPLQETYA